MKILLILLSMSFSAQSQTTHTELMEKNLSNIQETLGQLKSIPAEKYLDDVPELKEKVHQYLKFGKEICSGKFQSLTLEEAAKISRKRLNRSERKSCYLQLKSIQKQYFGSDFEAKKRYLKLLHQKQLDEVEKIHKENLSDLDQHYNRLR